MELEGYKEFLELRRFVMEKIGKVDLSDGCKSYEGTFELLLSYPNYFDEGDAGHSIDTPDFAMITLYCYVIGHSRRHKWRGKTILEAVQKAKKAIESWVD